MSIRAQIRWAINAWTDFFGEISGLRGAGLPALHFIMHGDSFFIFVFLYRHRVRAITSIELSARYPNLITNNIAHHFGCLISEEASQRTFCNLLLLFSLLLPEPQLTLLFLSLFTQNSIKMCPIYFL